MINLFLEPVTHGRRGWPSPRFRAILRNPGCHQQLPKGVRESRDRSSGSISIEDLVHNGVIVEEVTEWIVHRHNLLGDESEIPVGEAHPYLKDRHSNCVDIRALGGELFPRLTRKPVILREQ